MSAALDRFLKIRYPDVEFKVENYCDDELKLITSHVLIGGEEQMKSWIHLILIVMIGLRNGEKNEMKR